MYISSFCSSCDGYSDSQYEDMNGNGGEHYNFNRMAEDDYCKDINNSTNVAKFGPGQAWCLPKDYNQEKTPFTCKLTIIYSIFMHTYLHITRNNSKAMRIYMNDEQCFFHSPSSNQ